MKLKKLKKYKNIIITSIYLFIYTLFIIVFVANTIAGIKVQDMDIASLLCTIVCGTILSLEIYFNLRRLFIIEIIKK
jgi:hypothetical protein